MTDAEIHPERLIFGCELPDGAGVTYFDTDDSSRGDPIRAEDAHRLMKSGHLAPDERQNDGPPANVLATHAGLLDRMGAASVRIIGYVVPEPRPDARITLTGLVATPEPDDDDLIVDDKHEGSVFPDTVDVAEGEIGPYVKQEFRMLGGEGDEEHTHTQVGELFLPASDMTVGETFCRVWWD
jgi:hypothetical protein